MPPHLEHEDQPISFESRREAPKRKPWTPPRLDRSGGGLLDEVRQTKFSMPEPGVMSGATTS